MISYANLGGLGAREGKPVVHTWEPPPPEPPWIIGAAPKCLGIFAATLIVLPLFLFRQNRCAAAWWIWLPVVIGVPAGMAITCLITGVEWSLAQAVWAFIIGQAAMWLLMPYLESRHRIVTFFKALLVLAAFSLVASVPALSAAQNGWIDFRLYLVIVLALASLAATFAFTLAGFSVRHHFGRIRFLAWLAVWTAVAWVVIASPFMVVGAVNGNFEWGPSLVAILWAVGSTLALLLPLLLLSFFQPFYRSRFFVFLKVSQGGPSAAASVPLEMVGVDLSK